MRRHLHQPLRINLHHRPHILLTSQLQLIEKDPFRRRLHPRKRRARMNPSRDTAGFQCTIAIAPLLQTGCIWEEAGCQCLADEDVIATAVARGVDFDALAELDELVADVSRSTEGFGLDVVLL